RAAGERPIPPSRRALSPRRVPHDRHRRRGESSQHGGAPTWYGHIPSWSPMREPGVTRVSGVHGIVGVVWLPGAGEPQLSVAAQHLESAYQTLLGPGCRARSVWLDELRVGIVVLDDSTEPIGRRIVWGVPVSGQGLASDGDIAAALARPVSARSLLGTFVLVEVQGEQVRLVTSGDMIHTLKRVTGPTAVAWATRGLAAHVLADVRPRVELSHAVEHVLYDYVTGDDELLSDTVVVGEA